MNQQDNECMRMSKLVKDMLLLASSDAKSWTLCKNTIDIDTLLISLYEAYEPICISKKICLRLEISESSYPKFCADGERLLIKTAVAAKHITFFVSDHGKGIPEEA